MDSVDKTHRMLLLLLLLFHCSYCSLVETVVVVAAGDVVVVASFVVGWRKQQQQPVVVVVDHQLYHCDCDLLHLPEAAADAGRPAGGSGTHTVWERSWCLVSWVCFQDEP